MSGAEIEAYLTLLGQFSDSTGYPALQVRVVRPASIASVADRDLLVIGRPITKAPDPGAAAAAIAGSLRRAVPAT